MINDELHTTLGSRASALSVLLRAKHDDWERR